MFIASLLGCLTPFAEDRHDLTDFRIVGLAEADGELRAFAWSGYGLWHHSPPEIVWEIDNVAVTAAPSAPFIATATVTDAQGRRESARLEVAAGASVPAAGSVTRVVDGTQASFAFGLDDRTVTHWMGPSGEFEETGRHATNWTGKEGITPIIALHLDGMGGNAWSAFDVAIGDVGPVLDVGGRLFPVDSALSGEGWYTATVAADDGYAGVSFVELAPAADSADGEPVCGTDGFDLIAVAEGRCGRDDFVGARVAIYGLLTP